MNMQRLLTLAVASILGCSIAASALGQNKDAKDQTKTEAPAQPAKKKGFLDRLNDKLQKANEKLDKVNVAVHKQAGGAQPAEAKTELAQPAPQTDAAPATPEAPAGDAGTPLATEQAGATTAATDPANQQLVNQAAAPTQPAKKKGFFDRLNDNLKKANEKLDKVNSVVNKQTGGAQPVKAKTEPAQPAPQTDAAPTDQAAESPQNPSETDSVFKVGDRVEADPMRVSHWYKGTVIKIQQMSLGDVTGYVVRFDAVGDSDPAEYTVGNKPKWIRPLKQAPK